MDTFGSYLTQATQPQPCSAGGNFFKKKNDVNLVKYVCWAIRRGQREFQFVIVQADSALVIL